MNPKDRQIARLMYENVRLRAQLADFRNAPKTLATSIHTDTGGVDETVLVTIWKDRDGRKYVHFRRLDGAEKVDAGNVEEMLPRFFQRHPAPSAN